MRRRTVLASLAAGVAGVAGCSGSPGETPTLTPAPAGDDTDTPSPTETPTDGPDDADGDAAPGLGGASVVVLDTGPRTLALAPPTYRGPDGAELDVGFVETATADHPARLRATLTNGNGWPNTFRLREIPPFQPVTDSRLRHDACPDCQSRLYLAPTPGHDLVADAEPQYERGPEGYWRATGVPPELPPTVELSSGASVTGEYLLLGHVDRRGFPTGVYDFSWGDTDAFRIAAWHTDRPGPERESRFADVGVPPLPGADEVAWYHRADAATAAFLRPSAERVDLPGAVDFALVNHAREPLTGNPYYWKLWKLVDGDWYHVAPWGWPVPLSAIPPGGREPYGLRAFPGEAVPCGADHARSVGYLGGGTYAFEVGMARESTGWTHAALLDLRGPAVELAPTGDVSVTRDGPRVVVTAPEYGDGEHPPDARLTLRPVSGAAAPEGTDVERAPAVRVLAEQVMRPRNRALRNTLAFVGDGVEAVVLRADAHAVPQALRTDRGGGPAADGETRRVRFRGRAYELAVDVASGSGPEPGPKTRTG